MTTHPVSKGAGPSTAAVGLARAIGGGAPPAPSLVRRVAVVQGLNSDYTVNVTWPTGATVLSLPCLALPYPEVGDTVICLGYWEAAKDFVVVGPILAADPSTRPQPGRGVVTRTVTATVDGSAFFGPGESTFSVLTPPDAHFYAGRLYRSTLHCGMTTNTGGGSKASWRLYRVGGPKKYEGAWQDVPTDGFGTASVDIVCDYAMPDVVGSVEFRTVNSANGLKFYNRGNAFHTIEDIGPDLSAWGGPSP